MGIVVPKNSEVQEVKQEGIESIRDHTFLDRYGFNIVYQFGQLTLIQREYEYTETDEKTGEARKIYGWKETGNNQDIYSEEFKDDETTLTPLAYDYKRLYSYLESRNEGTNTSREFKEKDLYQTGGNVISWYENGIRIVIGIPTLSSADYANVIEKYGAEKLAEWKRIAQNPFPHMYSHDTHESSHAYASKKLHIYSEYLPPQYMSKLNMLDEIRANMAQAGLALDMYKATGTLEYFDYLSIDMDKVKNKLKQNPNMENPEGYVVDYIYKEWLNTHNQSGTHYSAQAKDVIKSLERKRNHLWMLSPTQDYSDHYHKLADIMFKNVEGLGDIRKYINPDFELNADLKQKLSEMDVKGGEVIRNPNLKAMMMYNANNAKEYSENLTALAELVMQIDADGYRTKEENALLDAYMQTHMASPQDDMAQTPENGMVLSDEETLRLKASLSKSSVNANNCLQDMDAITAGNQDLEQAGDNTAQIETTMIMKMADKGNVK